MQVEIGPSAALKSETEVDLKPVRDMIKLLDEAARRNVKVNVLLSTHYFPGWAYGRWPHLGKGGGGFFGFTIDEPEAKQVIGKFLNIVVPMLKDKPALNFCIFTGWPAARKQMHATS